MPALWCQLLHSSDASLGRGIGLYFVGQGYISESVLKSPSFFGSGVGKHLLTTLRTQPSKPSQTWPTSQSIINVNCLHCKHTQVMKPDTCHTVMFVDVMYSCAPGLARTSNVQWHDWYQNVWIQSVQDSQRFIPLLCRSHDRAHISLNRKQS